MQFTTTVLSLLPLLGLGFAAPAADPTELVPRACTTYYPTILQQLTESSPNAVNPNTVGNSGNFHVQRTVGPNGAYSNRVSQLVGFTGIKPGSYGCQLAVTFPAGYAVSNSPAAPAQPPQMNVTTVLAGQPGAVAYPNSFSWASSGSLRNGQGLFGTVSARPGSTAVVNSRTCDTALAFLVDVALWTPTTASVDFKQSNAGPLAGVYLTANC